MTNTRRFPARFPALLVGAIALAAGTLLAAPAARFSRPVQDEAAQRLLAEALFEHGLIRAERTASMLSELERLVPSPTASENGP